MVDEDLIRQRYDREVVPFWQAHAQAGQFTSRRGNGVVIRHVSCIHPARATAVVVSSGRTESYLKYKELAFDLWQQGYSVFIHDHRGQGCSARLLTQPGKGQLGHVAAFDDYVADLATFMEEVVRPSLHRRTVLLGHSMGGCVASLYLERQPAGLDRAVLSAPMHKPDLGRFDRAMHGLLWTFEKLGRGEDVAPGRDRTWDEAAAFDPKNELTHSRARWSIAHEEFLANPEARLAGPTIRWVVEAYNAGQRARECAGAILIPVLVLQAGEDRIVEASGQEEFGTELNARHPGACMLVRIDGARHELFHEIDAYRQAALDSALAFIGPA